MNSVVVPIAMLGSAGVTAIEVRVAGWPGGSPVSSPLVRHAVRRVMSNKINITKLDSRFMIFSSSSGQDLKLLPAITNAFAGSLSKVYHELCRTLVGTDKMHSCQTALFPFTVSDTGQIPGVFRRGRKNKRASCRFFPTSGCCS